MHVYRISGVEVTLAVEDASSRPACMSPMMRHFVCMHFSRCSVGGRGLKIADGADKRSTNV